MFGAYSKLNIERSTFKARFWQWPNILAIDAVLIALLWHLVFAAALSQSTHFAPIAVLGLSIWLTYSADRLFDGAKLPVAQLHSLRHQFAKHHTRILWRIWFGILAINIAIAFTGLTNHQLIRGAVLLALCLIYTLLNQKLSSRFFPKELCVAIIYASGVVVFLRPVAKLWIPAVFLMLLCLINCLIISFNERKVDAAMDTQSIARSLPQLPFVLYACCTLALITLEQQWLLPFGTSLTTLMLIHFFRKQLSIESFRVFADTALLTGPILMLSFS